jgi:acyl dehydratase
MLFLAGSMSHADHAKLQTGFHNAKYHWPAFAGDTFKKKFVIKSVRYALTNLPTYSLTRSLTHSRSLSDNKHSIFEIDCELTNQRGIVVFSCLKTMLFPFQVLFTPSLNH